MLPVVNYRLRDDLLTLIVCLYNPQDAPETTFTTETLSNYIRDCEWQLTTGEPVKRIPFYITASPVDAERASEVMRGTLQELRRIKLKAEELPSMATPHSPASLPGKQYPRGVNRNPAESEVTPVSTEKNKKSNAPYYLWKSTGKLYKPT